MKYLNFLLILVVYGCYSGVHTSNFNLTIETTPSCHTISGVQKVYHKILKFNFQINNNQERQSCCIDAVTYQIDFDLTKPVLTVSTINYYSPNNNFKNYDNFRKNNLNNHSPPKLFISHSSFLI